MIKGKIDGQSFALSTPIIVSDTIDYLSAQFEFSDDWNGTDKWAHFAHRSASRCEDISVVYDVKITNNKIDKSEHLNLTPGMWSVYIHGTRMENGVPNERITTNDDTFGVVECGLLEGEPLPLTPMSAAERILGMIGDLGELTLTTKTDIVSALNEVVSRIGSGGGGSGSNSGSGVAGKDGVGISTAEINKYGELILRLTDGSEINVGRVIGQDGADGKDGKTPVKGTDYWTASDKAGMVNDVLAALPTWNGGSY